MSEQVTARMIRGYEAMRRERGSFNYEKVFWNTAYGIGLVAMGWVTLKLGRIVQSAQDPIGAINDAEYKLIVKYVEEQPEAIPV